MPIDFFNASDGLHVRQSFESPTVYLDHWAIRLFSDDLYLQDRFVNALKRKNGTLLLSNISLLEFSGATDQRHCQDAERFIDRLIPNIYFTDFALDKVLDRESMELNNEKRFWPPADLPTLKFLAERKGNSLENISMHGVLSLAHENRDELLCLENETVCMLRDAFNICRNDSTFVTKARRVLPSDQRTRTFNIIGELMRGFNLDANSDIDDNDIIDLFHAMMPLNCCDYILLDGGPWEERIKKMNLRISKTSMSMPIAKCFSKRNNGVELFLSDLESFDKENNLIEVAQP